MFRNSILIAFLALALASIACLSSSNTENTTDIQPDSGASIFRNMGCLECHEGNAGVAAPPLSGLFGDEVVLENGDKITANADYLRESILSPNAKTVAGFKPIMPSYQGRISEEQLALLVDYIQSLSDQ